MLFLLEVAEVAEAGNIIFWNYDFGDKVLDSSWKVVIRTTTSREYQVNVEASSTAFTGQLNHQRLISAGTSSSSPLTIPSI